MPEGAGVVSALIMDNRLGRLRVSISVGGVIVFIVGSMNDEESRSMEGTVGREAADESVWGKRQDIFLRRKPD